MNSVLRVGLCLSALNGPLRRNDRGSKTDAEIRPEAVNVKSVA